MQFLRRVPVLPQGVHFKLTIKEKVLFKGIQKKVVIIVLKPPEQAQKQTKKQAAIAENDFFSLYKEKIIWHIKKPLLPST